jgi:hypothetical protein
MEHSMIWSAVGVSLIVYSAIVAQLTFSSNRKPHFFLIAYFAKLTGVIVFYLSVVVAVLLALTKVFGYTRQERRQGGQLFALSSLGIGLLYWWSRSVTGSTRK